MNTDLRDYQVAGIERLKLSILKGSKRPMVMAPTGAGKTKIAAAIIDGALRKGNRVLFTVPAVSLIDQTAQSFWAEGIRDVGVIQAQHEKTDWSRPVQIASVQTLMRRRLPDATLAIIDEAHRWFKFYEGWFIREDWLRKPIIGLSATPWTVGLGKYYDDLVIIATTQQLIDAGHLSPFRVFAPSHPDLTGVRLIAGDYHEGELSTAMQSGTLVADIVSTWQAHGENRPTFCFAVDCAHAKALQQQFEAAGVNADYLDAYTELDEREAIKRRFHRGETKVVCNVGVLTTGIDWDVRCLILARPTKSEMLFVQIIGRGLRTADGKDDCLILDHSDNHVRLGFVTDIHHDKLNTGKEPKQAEKEKGDPKLPKECPKCHMLKKTAVCPNCGFKAEPINKTEVADGELIEITPGAKESRKHSMAEKQIFLGELKGYAIQHGYKDGWALNKYREKFKVWADPSIKNVPPIMNQAEGTLQWIRSRQIAWARSQNKAA